MVASCGATSDAGKSSACLPGWAISGVWSCVTNISSRIIWLSRSWVASSSCFVPIYEMTSNNFCPQGVADFHTAERDILNVDDEEIVAAFMPVRECRLRRSNQCGIDTLFLQ